MRRQLGLRLAPATTPGLRRPLILQIPDVARFERRGLRIADETRRHHQRHEEIGADELVEAGELGRR